MENHRGKKILHGAYLSADFESIEVGKVDIEQEKVGTMLLGEIDCFLPGVCLDYGVAMLFEQFT